MFNIRQKTGIWGLLLLMIIFTPLTFVLALTNPVTDYEDLFRRCNSSYKLAELISLKILSS